MMMLPNVDDQRSILDDVKAQTKAEYVGRTNPTDT
jgi:hypothetical protein